MPLSRTKTFVNGGGLFPGDLNETQDDIDDRINDGVLFGGSSGSGPTSTSWDDVSASSFDLTAELDVTAFIVWSALIWSGNVVGRADVSVLANVDGSDRPGSSIATVECDATSEGRQGLSVVDFMTLTAGLHTFKLRAAHTVFSGAPTPQVSSANLVVVMFAQ